MHVGMSVIFQNPGRTRPDFEIYREEMALADMAEPLGFESVWSVEHHFTDYTMCPDPLLFLTYMAGRTKTVELGTMVVVLPWRDPIRTAEQISMLDNISEGRLILGIGRGAGRVEFDGFRLDMAESRPRFVEAAQLVLNGLENGYAEFFGEYYDQPRVDIRPEPYKSFRGRTYAAAVSPESARIMAELGVGLLVIPQKPWEHVEKEFAEYKALYQDVNGAPAPKPIFATWTIVDEDEKRAEEMAREYIGGYWQTVLNHYEFHKDHLKGQKGYEYYGKFAETLQKDADGAIQFFMDLQVYGTPEQCIEKITRIGDRIGSDRFTGIFSMCGMPHALAKANMELFAERVMPALKALPPAEERRPSVAAA
jgi:alkanesulfonate monooxygenase SsuD/methylene tetrahydromethanopterin reductase-like flavin-dependent oxidoreductase (luciferase family)